MENERAFLKFQIPLIKSKKNHKNKKPQNQTMEKKKRKKDKCWPGMKGTRFCFSSIWLRSILKIQFGNYFSIIQSIQEIFYCATHRKGENPNCHWWDYLQKLKLKQKKEQEMMDIRLVVTSEKEAEMGFKK